MVMFHYLNNIGCRALVELNRLKFNQDGVTAIEYALLASLVAIAAITAMTTVGTSLNTTFSTIAAKL